MKRLHQYPKYVRIETGRLIKQERLLRRGGGLRDSHFYRRHVLLLVFSDGKWKVESGKCEVCVAMHASGYGCGDFVWGSASWEVVEGYGLAGLGASGLLAKCF